MAKVLVVEDLDSDWRLIERQLRRERPQDQCRRAADGAGLDAALAEGGWDVVLADHAMPGLSFPNMLERIQAALPDVPVILVSGTIGEEAAIDLLRLGLADFVLKDRPGRLVPAIERSLVDRAQRDAAREADRARADSEAWTRALLDALADGVCVVQDGRIVFANPALHLLLELPPGATCVGQPLDADSVACGLAPGWSAPAGFTARLAGEPGPVERCDVPFLLADGRLRWTELSVSSFRHGERPAALAVVRDIDERQKLTAELAAHRDRLEQLVEERTHKAEAASRAKSAFLANMSHEIRTPLTAIIGMTHLLLTDPQTASAHGRVQRIADAAAHLLAILDDVLDVSRIEAGRMRLASADFALDELLARSLALVQPAAQRKGLKLRSERGAVPPALHGDATRLSQALVNLLGNAVKFTDEGEISLSCRLLPPMPGEAPDRLHVRFEVEDTGIGVETERIESLFQAFVQADDSAARRHGGSGLGLAITRRLAELMGGTAGGEPRPSGGSRFWFSAQLGRADGLPAPSPAPSEAFALARDVARRHAGARVLLAEDNEVNEEVALALLQQAGLQVEVARTGREALDRLAHGSFDLVLMDVQMPEMDGLAAPRLLRAAGGPGAGVPVLAMTANAFGDDRASCLAAGMNDHLGKPVEPRRLYEALLCWLPGTASGGSTSEVADAPAARRA